MARGGLIPFSGSFNRRIAEPLDDYRVATKADLLLAETWTAGDGVVYTWLGLFALVYGDTVNNGGYLLIASDYTLEASWLQIGSSVDLSDYVTAESLFRNGLIKPELLPDITSDVIELLELASILEDVVGMVAGDKAFYTDDNKIYTYSGTAWVNPQTPVVNKLYLCKFDNLTYKWNGTTLVATTSPLPYATNGQAIAGTSFSRVLSPYANKYAFNTWIVNYALKSWVTDNFAAKESGVEPPVAEVITLTTEVPTYTVVALTAENLNVASTATNGEILLLELDADKGVRINIQSGSNPIAIAGTSYAAGVSVFAVFDFDSTTWTVNSILDPVIPDYSDIAVAQYTTTGVVLSPIGYNKITAHNLGGTSAGNLIFVNNAAQPTAIGIYQALEGGTGDIKAKKIVLGTKLNVVRIKGGAVYHSEYDGANMASLKFSIIAEKELAITKYGINGNVYPTIFPTDKARVITGYRLATNCTDFSVTIGASTYTKANITNVAVASGAELIVNDLTIAAGQNVANAILILK